MKEKFSRFMYSRNGPNELSRFLLIISIISITISIFLKGMLSNFFHYLGLFTLIYSVYIVFSKKNAKQTKQNQDFIYYIKQITKTINNKKLRFKQRKTYKYYKCPNCGTTLRVPKGKGKIKIKCNKCGHEIIRKS